MMDSQLINDSRVIMCQLMNTMLKLEINEVRTRRRERHACKLAEQMIEKVWYNDNKDSREESAKQE